MHIQFNLLSQYNISNSFKLYFQSPPMSKKNQQNKKSALITQEEKTSNPIFNSIYKKIRNLNKKLANIQLLEKQPVQTLKQEQILKIQRKIDTVNQIKKNQEFALFYKSILEENGGASFDTSDLLIKVSTLLAVGQHAQNTNNIPKELKSVYGNSYQKATEYKDMNVSISDRVVDIFNILNDFLKSDKSYQACKNYISFLPEQKPTSQILQVQSKIQQAPQNKAQKKQIVQVQTVKHVPITEPVLQKPAKKVQQQIPKVVAQPAKVQQIQTKPQNAKKSWLGYSDDDHQNDDPVEKPKVDQTKPQPIKSSVQTKQQKEPQTLKESSNNQDQKSSQNKNTEYKPRNTNNYRRGNNQRGGYNNYHHQNSRPYQNHQYEEEQYHKGRNNYQQAPKNSDKKYNEPKKTKNNRDSGSDTSLQPTPEKLQKKQFVKYVQKR